MKRHGHPHVFVTDKLRSCGAALTDLGLTDDRKSGRWLNTRAEASHQPVRRRDRALLRFRRMRSRDPGSAPVTRQLQAPEDLRNKTSNGSLHARLQDLGHLHHPALCDRLQRGFSQC